MVVPAYRLIATGAGPDRRLANWIGTDDRIGLEGFDEDTVG